MINSMRVARWLAIVVFTYGCGDDTVGLPNTGADLSATECVCEPDIPTCGVGDVCGAPCDETYRGCTDHSCLEAYACVCNGGRLYCHSSIYGCESDLADPFGLE
jgi:hypothetical protein